MIARKLAYWLYHRKENIRAVMIDSGVAATASATAGIFQSLSIRNPDLKGRPKLTMLATEDRQEIFDAFHPTAEFQKNGLNAMIQTHDAYKKSIKNKKLSNIVHLCPAEDLKGMLKEKGLTVSRVN